MADTAGAKDGNYGQTNLEKGLLPKELDMIAAYIYGYQEIKDAYGRTMMFFRDVQTQKVFTPYERIIHAIRALSKTEFLLKIVRYDPKDNQVFRKNNGVCADDEQAESARKWNSILKWDRAYLGECMEKWGSAIEKLGFKRCEIPPILLTESTGKVTIETVGTSKHDSVKEALGKAKPKMQRAEDMVHDPEIADQSEETAQAPAKPRGRPKKSVEETQD